MCQRRHKVLSHRTRGGTVGPDEGYSGQGGFIVCTAWLAVCASSWQSHLRTHLSPLCNSPPAASQYWWISIAHNLTLTSSKKGDSWSERISRWNKRSREGFAACCFYCSLGFESAGKLEKWLPFPTFRLGNTVSLTIESGFSFYTSNPQAFKFLNQYSTPAIFFFVLEHVLPHLHFP